MRTAPPHSTSQVLCAVSACTAETCSTLRRPRVWLPGRTFNAPFIESQSSRCMRIASMRSSTDIGGCTFTTPALLVQGP